MAEKLQLTHPWLVAVWPGMGNVAVNAGVYLLDVRNPRRPRQLGGVNLPSGGLTHSITAYPGEPIVYSNPGGLPTNGRRTHPICAPTRANTTSQMRNTAFTCRAGGAVPTCISGAAAGFDVHRFPGVAGRGGRRRWGSGRR